MCSKSGSAEEYGLPVDFDVSEFELARWISSDDETKLDTFMTTNRSGIADDLDGDPVFLARNQFYLDYTRERAAGIVFTDIKDVKNVAAPIQARTQGREGRMTSSTYDLFAQAMADRKQIVCVYDGYPRELCSIVLGRTKGQEVALVYQFAGESKSGLPPGGQWKCLHLNKISDVTLRDGPWHAGSSHKRAQACVEIVDLDVNPSVPTSRDAVFRIVR